MSAVRSGGRVVQVGLGRSEATISTTELVNKAVTLRGSRGGHASALESVLSLMAAGELSIHATTVGFDEIPDAIQRLKTGGVAGRIVAVMAT